MANRNRRRTGWVGQVITDAISSTATTLIEVIPNAVLLSYSEEPTILRTIYRLLHGGAPDGEGAAFTCNSTFAFFLSPASADAIPNLFGDGLGDERIISSGFLSTAWQEEQQVVPGVLPLLISTTVVRNQRGPWQMAEGDTSAMRKVRSDDSLMLQVTTDLSGTQPDALQVRGYLRCLLAL